MGAAQLPSRGGTHRALPGDFPLPASFTPSRSITTDGKVNGYIDPRLAFGHGSAIGFLVWVFVGLFVVGLIGSIVASKWLGRVRRNANAEPIRDRHADEALDKA